MIVEIEVKMWGQHEGLGGAIVVVATASKYTSFMSVSYKSLL